MAGTKPSVHSRARSSPKPAGTSQQAASPVGPAEPPSWLRFAAFGLSILGLVASVYLTYTHFTQSVLLGCSETSGFVDCTKVTTSPQSVIFGVVPVAVLGLAFYVFMVAIMSPWAWRLRWPLVGYVRVASLVAGVAFVLYLVYAELFEIGNICAYCTSVHVITFLLFVLIMFGAAVWGVTPVADRQPERGRHTAG